MNDEVKDGGAAGLQTEAARALDEIEAALNRLCSILKYGSISEPAQYEEGLRVVEVARFTLRAALAPPADGTAEVEEVERIRKALSQWTAENVRYDTRAMDFVATLLRACDAERARRVEVEGAFNMEAHLERQRAWSRETFGMLQRPAGVIDHIRKELLEIEADPTDLEEWVDVIILAFDGAWRAGWEPADILKAIVAKQTKNESRVWPDWRTADPDKAVEHVRSHDPATNKDTQDE